MIKRFSALFIGIIYFLCIPGIASAELDIPSPMHNYVSDFAGTLSSTAKQTVENMAKELEEKTGAQLVVVLIETLQGASIEEYANTLFRQWGIGQREQNNGVLLLIAPNERESRIEVGYGLEGRLPDGKTGRIQDEYLIPYLMEGDYDSGIIATYQALAAEVADEYGVELTGVPDTLPGGPIRTNNRMNRGIPVFLIILFFIDIILFRGRITRFIFEMFFWGAIFGGRRGGGGGSGGFGGGGGFSGGGGSSRKW